MIKVVGVRFKKAGKIYYFDPEGLDINKGENVIVETIRGIEFGNAAAGIKEVSEEDIVAPLKKVLRVATVEDCIKYEENKSKEGEAFRICLDKIKSHDLGMKLIEVEYTFDNNKIIFYFTADGRVDFRELVKDLAAVFKTRIELRQIGVRDEAKMLSGIGPCGRGLCCATFLGEFEPVSIKMAKEQSLSLNPTKISGICGRLMCCLKYEQDVYEEVRKTLPKVGALVDTAEGKGEVIESSVLYEKVKVKMDAIENNMKIVKEFSMYDVKEIIPGKDLEPELEVEDIEELEFLEE